MVEVMVVKVNSLRLLYSYMVLHDGSQILGFEHGMFNNYLWKHAIIWMYVIKGVFGMKENIFHGKCFPRKQVDFGLIFSCLVGE